MLLSVDARQEQNYALNLQYPSQRIGRLPINVKAPKNIQKHERGRVGRLRIQGTACFCNIHQRFFLFFFLLSFFSHPLSGPPSGPGFGTSFHLNTSVRDFVLSRLSQGEILLLASPPAERNVTMIRANRSMTTILFFCPGKPAQRWYATHHAAGVRLLHSYWLLEKENPTSI